MRRAPFLIRLLSKLCIAAGAIAFMELAKVWLSPAESSNLHICFDDYKFVFIEHPIVFPAISLFLIFSGITGCTIVNMRPYAYDLGIACCIFGIFLFGVLTISKIDPIQNQIVGMAAQIAILGGFLNYFVRHRTEWKSANQRIHSTQPQGKSAAVRPQKRNPDQK